MVEGEENKTMKKVRNDALDLLASWPVYTASVSEVAERPVGFSVDAFVFSLLREFAAGDEESFLHARPAKTKFLLPREKRRNKRKRKRNKRLDWGPSLSSRLLVVDGADAVRRSRCRW